MRALIDGEEKERERVANELHDGLASDLTGIKLILSQSEEKLPEGVSERLIPRTRTNASYFSQFVAAQY
jgi:two-component system NarL family sensor kinase